MPVWKRKFARKRKRFGKRKSIMKKKVAHLSKYFLGSGTRMFEYNTVTASAFGTSWVGLANTNLLSAGAQILSLTTLGTGTGAQQREGTKVQFERALGNVEFYTPTNFTFSNVTQTPIRIRLFGLRIKTMYGDPAAHTLPPIADIFQTSATIAQSEMLCPLTVGEMSSSRNYDILFDHVCYMSYSTTGLSAQHTRRLKNHKDFYTRVGCKPVFSGVGNQITYCFDLDLSKFPMTSYDGTSNSLANVATGYIAVCAYIEFAPANPNQIFMNASWTSFYRVLD